MFPDWNPGAGFCHGGDLYRDCHPQLARRPVLAAAACARVTALLARGLPYKLGLMLAAAAGVLGGMLAERGLAKQEPPS